jgi:hypothetical protein
MFHLDHSNQTPEDDRDRRFTLPETTKALLEHFGLEVFGLDAAAEDAAHVCDNYFTVKDNGLERLWFDHAFCNPPWSDCGSWVRKAWAEWKAGHVRSATLLLPVRTEQPFWQNLIEPYRDQLGSPLRSWFMPRRQRFGNPEDPLGAYVGSPPFICVALHWGRHE